MRGKTKTNRTLYAQFFSRALSTLPAIARNSDWLVELFAPVVIARSNYFGTLIFRQSFENCFINYTSSFHSDEVLTLETSALLYIYDDNLTFINSLDSKLLCLTSPSTYNLRFFRTQPLFASATDRSSFQHFPHTILKRYYTAGLKAFPMIDALSLLIHIELTFIFTCLDQRFSTLNLANKS